MEQNLPGTQTSPPPKLRDLSARYGQNQPDSPNLSHDEEDLIPPIGRKHPFFVLLASLGTAALYAELIFFAATYYGNSLSLGLNIAAIVAIFLVTFGAVYASYTLPHHYYRSRFHRYSPIIFLVMEWTVAVVLLLAATALTFVVGIFMVDGQLGAVSELLRSLALYAIVAIILFHGLVVYVRYVRYLYEREMHQSYKIVSFAGVLSVIVLVLTLYLLQFDLGRMGGSGANQGWLALHLSIRDVGLLALTLYGFIWHATVLADH